MKAKLKHMHFGQLIRRIYLCSQKKTNLVLKLRQVVNDLCEHVTNSKIILLAYFLQYSLLLLEPLQAADHRFDLFLGYLLLIIKENGSSIREKTTGPISNKFSGLVLGLYSAASLFQNVKLHK
jgi:hypothetical protein